MKRSIILLLVLFFISLVSAVCFGNYANPPDYFKDNAYNTQDGNRTILFTRNWGAVFYLPNKIGSINYKPSERIIDTDKGRVKIEDQPGSTSLVYPQGSLTVAENLGEIKVSFQNKNYRFSRNLNDLKIVLPNDEIRYSESINKLTIEGRQGKVTYSDELSNIAIVSSAGTTRRKPALDGGFSIEGAPVSSHPYRCWGAEFIIPELNIGVVIDFRNYSSIQKYAELFNWNQTFLFE